MSRALAAPARVAWSRLLAALLTLWFVGAPAATAVHLGLVRHVVCASHGELVHEHEDQHHGEVSVVRGHLAVHASDHEDTPAGHLHDHCAAALTAAPATSPTWSVTPVIAPAAAAEVAPVPLRSRLRRAEARIYAFAPKTSPPLARVAI